MKPSLELAKREAQVEALDRPVEPPQSYNYGVDPNAENEVHLLDYWRAIRKRLWLVAGIVALVTMLAVVYVARKPDFYEAQARVQVDLASCLVDRACQVALLRLVEPQRLGVRSPQETSHLHASPSCGGE